MMNSILKRKFIDIREIGLVGIIIIIYLFIGFIQPRFFSLQVLMSLLLTISITMLVSIGEMITIISRNIELSLGTIMACTAVTGGMIFKSNIDFPIIVVFLISLVLGGLLGAINGFIVTKFKISSVIVTIGTASIYRGLLFVVMNAKQIDNMYIPKGLIKLAQPMESIIGVPYVVIIAVAAAIVAALVLNKTKLGRNIYAIGSNPAAAELRGINVKRTTMYVFLIAGMCSGFSGILYMALIGYVNPITAGANMDFMSIAAVVIGGSSLAGGSGKTVGTILGCFLMGLMGIATSYLNLEAEAQLAVYGLIIIVAVIIEKVIKNRVKQ